MKILVTGSAGFIGFHVTKKLLDRGDQVLSLDNINDYYDVSLKYSRLEQLGIKSNNISYGKSVASNNNENHNFIQLDLSDTQEIDRIFKENAFDGICHLAAQAGVRYSIENPHAYIQSNINGFINILEGCRNSDNKNLVYASSSSVYGANENLPFSVDHNVDHPLSLYAATKKSNELMAHSYSSLYELKTTGLRFFTVYGPWGRPDMALFLFTKAIYENKPIDVFNHGNHSRDFTYIDDIVDGIISCIDKPAEIDAQWNPKKPNPSTSKVPYRVYNIGNSNPSSLEEYINVLEEEIGISAKKNYLPMQKGDVPSTFADIKALSSDHGYTPSTSIKEGVSKFVKWYKSYYSL